MSKSFLQVGDLTGTEYDGDFLSTVPFLVPNVELQIFDEFYKTEMTNDEFDRWIDEEIQQNTDLGKIIQSNLNGPYQGLGTISDKHGLYVMLKDMGYTNDR